MKKIILSTLAIFMFATAAHAQGLSLKRKYYADWHGESVSWANKPNGKIYRLREEIQCDDLPLIPRLENSDEHKLLIIAERTAKGWMALYRNEMLAENYDFVVVFYDADKNPVSSVDLCMVSNTYNCEVQDLRYDAANDFLMFNMACPSYSEQIDGKGSKLFCYNVGEQRMMWSTPYLTSNDIFIFNDRYVFCSYGFTNEKDYIHMVDKFTGKVYSKLLTSTAVDYMEIQQKDGKDLLYAVDYNDYLYVYNICDTTPAPQSASSSAKKLAAKKPAAKKSTTSKKR